MHHSAPLSTVATALHGPARRSRGLWLALRSQVQSTRVLLTELPALSALIECSTSSIEAVGARAGWLICLLASESVSAAKLLELPTAIPALLRHGGRETIQAKEEAAWALATLSADSTHATKLADRADVPAFLLTLMDVPSNAVSLQAVWAIANLTLLPAARYAIAYRTDTPLHAPLHGHRIPNRHTIACPVTWPSHTEATHPCAHRWWHHVIYRRIPLTCSLPRVSLLQAPHPRARPLPAPPRKAAASARRAARGCAGAP